MGQASGLSVLDDGQDVRPTGNLPTLDIGDWVASLAMTTIIPESFQFL